MTQVPTPNVFGSIPFDSTGRCGGQLSVVRFHFFPAKAAIVLGMFSFCTRIKPPFRCTRTRTPTKWTMRES